jgi:hypothetical protein
MAEKLNLNKFKSSGVYTIEIDESGNLALPLSTGRLVIGSSKKGPINSVVLLNSTRELSAVYGDTDLKLEKNGSYFHRTLDVALRQGPVYALNVLPVTNNDTAAFATFNTEAGSANSVWNSGANVDALSNFYNTQKLWFADVDMVNKYKNINLGDDYISTGSMGIADRDANKILTFVNLSRKAVTVWVRIADTTGYNLPVKEYYRLLGDTVEVPEFLNPDDIVANLFVDVIAVEGDWTNYLALSNDPVYGQYFNEDGIIDSKFDDFTSVREVTLINRTQGCIAPDFRDLTGSIVSIDALFNRKFATTGLYCAVDYKKIDLINLENTAFVSGSTAEAMPTQRLDMVGFGLSEQSGATYGFDDGASGPSTTIDPVKKVSVLSYVKPASSEFYFDVTGVDPGEASYALGEVYINTSGGFSYIVAVDGSRLYSACAGGFIKSGDKVLDIDDNVKYLKVENSKVAATSNFRYIAIKAYTANTLLTQAGMPFVNGDDSVRIQQATVEEFEKMFELDNTDYFYEFSAPLPTKLVVTLDPTLYGNTNKNETKTASDAFNAPYNATKRALVDEFFKPGHFIKASIVLDENGDPVERPRYLRIKSISSVKRTGATAINNYVGVSGSVSGVTSIQYTITVDSPYDVNNLGIQLLDGTDITIIKGVKNFVKNLKGIKLPALTLNDQALYPNGTSTKQDEILDFVMEDSNLGMTLADNETVDFRYIIDSFEGQISSSSKSQIVQLAANHGKCLAICNAPSIAQYERSVDPSFIDFTTRLVSPEFISTGGDLDANPSFTFGFAAGDKNGIPISSYSAYFMPNVVIFEAGKNKSIPPAMYVANAFMRKYNSGNTFSIVAGRRGILTEGEITGLEYDLTNEDRDYLEPAGFNLLVRRRGFGIMVFSNNTGYQKVRSALNNIHVREALATIERDIERILLNFLFDFNDTATRMRVKTLVTNYLTAVQDARGIASAEVIFDDSNNPVEVLEANAGVIDIIVDFPRGIHKFINRITITRAGGQLASNSTGFTPSF